MTRVRTRRLATAVLASAAMFLGLQWRSQAAGPISGTVFEDFNGNGLRDTTTTVPSDGSGATAVAVDRGMAGITVTVYDSAGLQQGTATTAANGTYTVNATGTGPYRVEFTSLPSGYVPSRFGAGATGNGTTVQFVPDGTSVDVNLGILNAANYCQDNPSLVTSCFVFGDAAGAFGAEPAVVDFPYSSGSDSASSASSYNVPTTHALMVAASRVGSIFGLGHRPGSNTVYAGAFMKKHSGFGPGGTGAIYAIDATTGATTLFADLNAVFGAGTAGADPHDPADYDRDNGNSTWDAVGKVSLGGLELSPDGAFVFVVNLADRRVYRIPTGVTPDSSNVLRVQIPLNAPGATGAGADLRPFALQYHRGVLYVGVVNSAESAGASTADLRAYVYTLDPATMVFGASPVFQFVLNYPRGAVQTFSGIGPAAWNRWIPGFATQSPPESATDGVGTYPQPMFGGMAFDVQGNLTIGLRDRAGDQFGLFALEDPGSSMRFSGVSAGDTLLAAIVTPGDLSSGWVLESNAQAGAFGPTAGAGNAGGPGNGEYYFADFFPVLHEEVSGGSVLQLPGAPDVVSSGFDTGLSYPTGGFMWLRQSSGARAKGYNLYQTLGAPPQPTFAKVNGLGEFVALCQAAPIEIGNRVWDDVDGDGVQDPGEPGLDGVTVQLIAPGGAVLTTALTRNGGQYYFSSGSGTTTDEAIYNVAGLVPNTAGYRVRIDATQGAIGGRGVTAGNNDLSANGDSRDSDGAAAGSNAEVVFATGAAGATTHTYDFGFTTAPLANLSLGDLVWYDTNNNGTVDGGELPIGGVAVVLYRDDGNGTFDATVDTFLGTQATSGGGLYLFTGLTPGTYFVQIPQAEFSTGQTLSGYQNSSGQTPGDTNDADHGVPAPVTGQGLVSDVVTLSAGGEPTTDGDGANSNRTIDFGFYRLSLGDLVFNDANNSGTFEAGDTPRDGVTVDLLDAAGVTVLATTTTAGGGLYSFTGLAPGDYRVRITTPAGLTSSTGGSSEPAVDPDNDVDNDDNGTTSGAFIVSAPVTLTPGSEPAVTNANGESANTRVDFGLIPATLSLGNLVWLDVNNNGVADSGEPGLAGVTVRLIAANGSTVLGTTTTDSSGNYLFSNLPAGTYIVEVDRTSSAITGYLSSTDIASSATPDNDVNNDDNGIAVTPAAVRSAPVTLSLLAEPVTDGDSDPNSNLSVDFGFVRALSLGNLVWADVNNNGLVDAGETGIGGVTVRLIAADGVTVLQTTTTNASGRYLFGGLPPGSYYVEVVPPSGSQSSTDIASSGTPDNDVDNDDNGVTIIGGAVRSGPITLGTGAEPTNDGDTNPDSNLTVDFGFVPPLGGGLLTDLCLQQVVPATVAPGGLMTATYTATNRGPGAATDVIIDGMLPPGLTVVSTTTSPGGVCTVTPDMLDCRWPGNTPAGPSGLRQVTAVFQVAASVPPGTPVMLWFMTSSSNPDPYPACNMVDAYVFVSGGPVAPVDLVISGAVSAAGAAGTTVAAAVNQPVTGRFTVTNTGAAPARGRYVIQLDEAGVLEVASATLSQGWAGVSTATAGVWETELIAPGASATLDLRLVPRAGTAAKIQAIRIEGAPADPNAANDSAEFVVDAVGAGGGRVVAVGNLDGAAGGEIVTGNGQGETPQVQVFSGVGTPLADFYAFDRAFLGGVRVASCDVNGDGRDEIIAAQGPGGGRVRVLSLAGGVVSEVVAFDAFESGFTGGVNVACADLDLDGRGEVVVGPDGGRAPDVKVFTVGALSAVVTAQFQAYEPGFTGGVRVAASRFGGSAVVGAFGIATMPGPGRAMEVRTWQVNGATVTFGLGATLSAATTGARVVLGDINNDATLDLVVTPDGGAPALLQAFSLANGAVILNAPMGAGGFRSLHAAVGVLGGGPGVPELVVGSGPGQAPTVLTVIVGGGGAVVPRVGLTVFEKP
jgi:uncharacterized repeat protein (TIGR01451 family)